MTSERKAEIAKLDWLDQVELMILCHYRMNLLFSLMNTMRSDNEVIPQKTVKNYNDHMQCYHYLRKKLVNDLI